MRSIGSLSPVYRLLLVSLGLGAFACGTDPVPNLPKFPIIPKLDAGAEDEDGGGDGDGDDEVTCSGGSEVGATQTRTRYQATTVPGDQTCVSEQQMRTCLEGGTWSDWSGEYEAADCTPEAVDGPCEDGATETRTRWTLVETDAGDIACESEEQTHTCESGEWGTWSGSYVLENCAIDYEDCDGQPHGTEETRKRYASATAEAGQACEEETQTRECNDGLWTDWTGTYTEETCAPADGKCDGKDNGTVETRTRYEAEVAEPGQRSPLRPPSATPRISNAAIAPAAASRSSTARSTPTSATRPRPYPMARLAQRTSRRSLATTACCRRTRVTRRTRRARSTRLRAAWMAMSRAPTTMSARGRGTRTRASRSTLRA